MASYDVYTAQQKLQELADRSSLGEKITICNEAGNIVMVSEEEWDDLVEAVHFLSMPGMLSSLRKSEGVPEQG